LQCGGHATLERCVTVLEISFNVQKLSQEVQTGKVSEAAAVAVAAVAAAAAAVSQERTRCCLEWKLILSG
jgi:hypothetical protein